MSSTNENNKDAIPVVDLSRDDDAVAADLVRAFTSIGFATLTHHGVHPELIANAFAASKSFFELPTQTKQDYKYDDHKSNRGYIGVSNEKHQAGATADYKETFDIGNEAETSFRNKWPSASSLPPAAFRTPLLSYFHTMDALHLRIMKLLAIGLHLPDTDYFVDRCDAQHENLRLLRYREIHDPKFASSSTAPIVRGAVHTDYGTITLLTQDSVGGLRVQRVDGTWLHVPPVQDSIVVNVGDMLQRWSNDVLKATPHQVVEVASRDSSAKTTRIPERYSIAFFCNANKDVMLECLEQFQSKGNPAKHPPVNAHDYLTMRLAQTISTDDNGEQ